MLLRARRSLRDETSKMTRHIPDPGFLCSYGEGTEVPACYVIQGVFHYPLGPQWPQQLCGYRKVGLKFFDGVEEFGGVAGWTGRWEQVHCLQKPTSPGVPAHCTSKKSGWESQKAGLLMTVRYDQGLGACFRFLQSSSGSISKRSSSQRWGGVMLWLRMQAQSWCLGTCLPPCPSQTTA